MSLLDNEDIILEDRSLVKQNIKEWIKKNVLITPYIGWTDELQEISNKLNYTDMPWKLIHSAIKNCHAEDFDAYEWQGYRQYEITDDLEINVVGNMFFNVSLEELPYKFNRIIGDFDVSNSNIKSLHNCPNMVMGDFDCSDCLNLTSLKGAPTVIGNDLVINNCCGLKQLDWIPKAIGNQFQMDCIKNFIEEINKFPERSKEQAYSWLAYLNLKDVSPNLSLIKY